MQYKFKCPACGAVLERTRKMGDTAPEPCICGGSAQKIIEMPAVIMGWRDSDSVHSSIRFRPSAANRTAQATTGGGVC